MKSSLKKNLICSCILSAAIVFPVLTVAAEERPEEYSLDEVVVTANRIPGRVSKAAANVTVISREAITRGHHKNLGDVLRQVNGVVISGGAFGGQKETVRINGDDRVLVMIDGRRISRPEGSGDGHASVDLQSIVSLENIERIEVIKGGASALYGADAVGGVINIISRKGTESSSTLRQGISSSGVYDNSFTNQGKEKDISWFVSYEKKQQDHTDYNSLPDKATKSWPNSRYDSNSFTLRLDKEIDENRSVTLNFEHSEGAGGQPYSLSMADQGQSSCLWNNWALTFNFNRSTAVPGFVRVYENCNRQEFYGTYQSRTQGFQFQTGWQTDSKNTLVAGTEWTRGTVLKSTSDWGGLTKVNYQDKAAEAAAVYLQNIWKPAHRWTITPGLRYDHYNRFGGQVSPKLQVNYSANSKTDYYASYNKVFRVPSLDDLYYNSTRATGNPNLKPETGSVITVGVNHRFSDSTSTQLSYFDSKISNAIYWLGWPMVLASNVDERKQGFEFTLKHDFSEKYYAELGYSYLKARGMSGTSHDLEKLNSQPNGYRISLGYKDADWNVGLEGNSVTGRYCQLFSGRDYNLWNFRADYLLNRHTKAYFKINNLTNAAYQVKATVPAGDSPMPARNYQMGLQYTF